MHYLWKALRRARAPLDGVDVVGFKRQQTGCLRGQILTCFIGNYPTEEQARAAHPGDRMNWVNEWTKPQVYLNHLPDDGDPEATLPGRFYMAEGQ